MENNAKKNRKSWDDYCHEAEEFYKEHGHLQPPSNTKLYAWLKEQRYAQKGIRGIITDEQIDKLSRIGMVWDSQRDLKWKEGYTHAIEYKEKHGNINVSVYYVSPDGYRLGRWIAYMRHAYRARLDINFKQKKHKSLITDDEIIKLEELGMIWDTTWLGRQVSLPEYIVFFYIKNVFPDAKKLGRKDFIGCEIDIFIPTIKVGIEYDGYVWHKDRIKLDEDKGKKCKEKGVELIRIREKPLVPIENCSKNIYVKPKEYSDLQKAIKEILLIITNTRINIQIQNDLNRIINEYSNYMNAKFVRFCEAVLAEYYGDCRRIKKGSYSADGLDMYDYLSKLREAIKANELTNEQKKELERLKFDAAPFDTSFKSWITKLQKYKKENGHVNVPVDYIDNDGNYLGKWLSHVRENMRKGQLSPQRISKLEKMGVDFNPQRSIIEERMVLIRDYYAEYNTINIPVDTVYKGVSLGCFIEECKKKKRKNKLHKELDELLTDKGLIWNPREYEWNKKYEIAKKFYMEFGNISVNNNSRIYGGIDLYNWLSKQKEAYHKGILNMDRLKKLEEIGITWDEFEHLWMKNYELLKLYHEEYGNINIPSNRTYKGVNLGMWLSTQRQAYRGNPNYAITEKRIFLLEKLGMDWKRQYK